MYLKFFNLKDNPFSLVTDPRFFYYSDSHCEAMAHLLYGVRERKGVILMLGDAGTGKTSLVRATLEMLRSTRVVCSVVMNPLMSTAQELLEAILAGFGGQNMNGRLMQMVEVLTRFLQQQVTRGHIPVIIVDEAQQLSADTLSQLRLLSNLEFNGHKLLQIVLVGQPELGERLDEHEYRALRQRIVVRYRLSNLSARHTWNYISTRLTRAGCPTANEVFTPEAVETIYTYTSGIPRMINTLADNSLIAAYAKEVKPVTPEIVRAMASHLELQPAADIAAQLGSVHADVMRASSSWKELVKDIETGTAPTELVQFVQNLRPADERFSVSKAITNAG